ncbi:MAG: hypothetical protein ACPG49_12280 [Chitinophagales bacterium]
MLSRVFLVFTITLLSLSFGVDAQTKKAPSSSSKFDRNMESKAKLQRNLERNASSRYNPNSSQRAFAEMAKNPNKDASVINGYELQFNSYIAVKGEESLASIVLYASGKEFGKVMFFGLDEAVASVKQKMGERKSLEDGEPVMLAYHIDMLPNILAFLESSHSVAVVLDKSSRQLSLSSGKVNMWDRR